MEIKESVEEFQNFYSNFAKELKEKRTEKLKEVFKIFWEQNPKVKYVYWTQYAPYFNDGDPCVFSVNELYFSNKDEIVPEELYDEYFDGDNGEWVTTVWGLENDPQFPFNIESAKGLQNFLSSDSMETIMEMLFGSNNMVVASREGFNTTEFDNHD